MKYALIVLLLVAILITTGCVQVQQENGSCGSEALAVTYVAHNYLWGNDGFMTKRYDITVYVLGFPSVKTGISKYEFDTYKQTYCRASTNQPTSTTPLKTTITTIRTPTPSPTHKITDGYWCLNSEWDVSGQRKMVKDCYQFFSDGSYKIGDTSSGGTSMVRPRKNCHAVWSEACGYWSWSINSKGEVVLTGADTDVNNLGIFNGYNLGFYSWSSTGL
jgi:hypothetical protein